LREDQSHDVAEANSDGMWTRATQGEASLLGEVGAPTTRNLFEALRFRASPNLMGRLA
jgi:hypothetical protein